MNATPTPVKLDLSRSRGTTAIAWTQLRLSVSQWRKPIPRVCFAYVWSATGRSNPPSASRSPFFQLTLLEFFPTNLVSIYKGIDVAKKYKIQKQIAPRSRFVYSVGDVVTVGDNYTPTTIPQDIVQHWMNSGVIEPIGSSEPKKPTTKAVSKNKVSRVK